MSMHALSSRHAFLVLAHKQPRQINALSAFFAPYAQRAHVFIHLDVKYARLLPELVQREGVAAFSRHRTSWGGFGIVRATLDLLQRATEHAEYDYIHLLSGQCLPLQPVLQLMAVFDRGQREHMHCTPFPVHGIPYRGFDRILVEYPPRYQGRYRGARAKELEDYKEAVLRDPARHRKVDHMPPLYHGSQWFSVTGACAKAMLRVADERPELGAFFASSLIPDEMFFQTVLMLTPFREALDPQTYRYMDWKRGGPYAFAREDLPELLASPMLFARKFDIGKDEALPARLLEALALRAAHPDVSVAALLEATDSVNTLADGKGKEEFL